MDVAHSKMIDVSSTFIPVHVGVSVLRRPHIMLQGDIGNRYYERMILVSHLLIVNLHLWRHPPCTCRDVDGFDLQICPAPADDRR